MKLEYNGYIKNGKFTLRNKAQFLRDVEKLPDMEMWVTFEKKKSKRSEQQSRYYWGVCVDMIRARFVELGNECSKDDIHCFLKSKFLYTEVLKDDEVLQIPRSSATLNKSEFSEFIEKIQRFASETLDIVIPSPLEQTSLNL